MIIKLKIAFAICFKTLQAAYQVSCRNLRYAIEQGQSVAHTGENAYEIQTNR